jgi:toxin-antitoxin system PIN domain toxin
VISFDTNILFPALEPSHPHHTRARQFLEGLSAGPAAICELVLTEVYVMVRNPATARRALGAAEAADLIHTLRTNPAWRLVDYPGGLMDGVWRAAREPGFARRRVFDARLGLTLRHHGVTEFATANVKDFAGLGFQRVFSPLG